MSLISGTRDFPARVGGFVVGLLVLTAVSGALLGASSDTTLGWWVASTQNVVLVVVSVLLLSLAAGSLAGALVAYGPRVFAGALGRLVELSGALPSLVIVGLWRLRDDDPSIVSFIAILAALRSIEVARLIASETDRISSQGFVVAARSLGASPARIFRVHVLPHLLPTLAVSSALTASAVVNLEAALSFVGLGLPGSTSWGALLGEAARAPQVPDARVALALASIVLTTLALYGLARAVAKRWE